MTHCGKRLFITGIPTAGKSYLAKHLAEKAGGIAVCLDDFRDRLVQDEQYKKWVNFYLDQDEERYITQTSPDRLWENLVKQSEGLWPAFLAEINSYEKETRPVIFECVNILPHLARRDLDFPGIVLLGSSYGTILKRNNDDPRWGETKKLQELEAKYFWEVERPRYKKEAEKFDYPVFGSAELALEFALRIVSQQNVVL